MFQKGNQKLGSSILSWSLPAVKTCPGRTTVCEKICYAAGGNFRRPNVAASLARNQKFSESKDFVASAIFELSRRNSPETTVVRVHASGDFRTAADVVKWRRIAKASPKIRFFCYTRSWRKPAIERQLQRLAALPNFLVWYSADAETGRPPKRPRVRVCYLSRWDGDNPPFPVDLVFRDNAKTPMKFVATGELVCPYENRVTPNVTCQSCGVCWGEQPTKKKAASSRRPSLAAAALAAGPRHQELVQISLGSSSPSLAL